MNRLQNPSDILKNIRIVLVRPIYGGNVGAVCRSMANNGLSDLVLVTPRELDMDEARARACWAQPILENMKTQPSVAEAVSDCSTVYGTTARLGLYRLHSQTPREAAPRILANSAHAKTALLFGPEDNGLSNEDIALCTNLMQIPSTPEYSSLNLSHAVAICAYEIYVATDSFQPSEEKSPPAKAALREKMFELWESALLSIGFMKQDKAQHMMLGIRRVLSRGAFTEDDTRIMMGVAKQTQWCADKMKELNEKEH